MYNALLSRSTVFEFKALTPEETVPAVERALALQQQRSSLPLAWEEEVPRLIAAGCGGDVRKAVNAVELLYQSAKPRDGGLLLTTEDAQVLAQRSAMRYDREGDRALRPAVGAAKIHPWLGSGCGGVLSGAAAGGGRSVEPLPPAAGHRQRRTWGWPIHRLSW